MYVRGNIHLKLWSEHLNILPQAEHSLYKRLQEDYQLPSITTLTRLTSKCNNLKDNQILQILFGSLEDSQKTCLLLIDEVYVKPALHFHAGSIFGRAVNRPDQYIQILCLDFEL